MFSDDNGQSNDDLDSADPVEEERKRARKADETRGYRLAVGMIGRDLGFLIVPYLLTILPQLIQIWFPRSDLWQQLVLLVGERAFQILALYLIATRWLAKLRPAGHTGTLRDLGRLEVAGFAFWFVFMIPLMAQFSAVTEEIKLFFVLLLIPGTVLLLRYYFYFFPFSAGATSAREAFASAESFTDNDRFLALRAMIAPLGAMSLVLSLVSIPSPDRRHAELAYLDAVGGGLFWILSCYVALGLCLSLLSTERWAALGLDPNRNSRFTEIQLGAVSYIENILAPKNGIKMLAVSLLVWFGNIVSLMNLAPAPEIAVKSIEVEGKRLRMGLEITDREFLFRGFQPIHFALAGDRRDAVISPMPVRASLESTTEDVRLYIPEQTGPIILRLEFEATRAGKDLVALEDLHLWYRNHKVQHLNMKSARLVATREEAPSHAGPEPSTMGPADDRSSGDG